MRKSNLITEISLEDFLKLDLKAYEHRKHYFDKTTLKEIPFEKTGEFIADSRGMLHWVGFGNSFSKLCWDKVSLNEIVLENIEFSEKEKFKNRCICVAIHNEPPQKEIEGNVKLYNEVYKNAKNYNVATEEDIKKTLLLKYSYVQPWLGRQTYLLRCDVPHLYSEKRKFCTHDDYFEIPKNKTKVVYLIRY